MAQPGDVSSTALCAQYDLVSFALGKAEETQSFRDHLRECGLCSEELEAIEAFLATNGPERIAEAYLGLDLISIAVPKVLLDHCLPQPAWERLLDDLRSRWAALGRPLFIDLGWELVRLKAEGQLRPGRRPRYFIGQKITLRLRVDEDCWVAMLHMDAQGRVTRVVPEAGQRIFLRAGQHEIPGVVQGEHDGVQRLIILAAKVEPPLRDPSGEVLGVHGLEGLFRRLEALPADQWCWSEYEYRVVDPARTSLEDLEGSCQLEIRDKGDTEKAACGEVSRRVLDETLPISERWDAFPLFYKITSRLIRHWIDVLMPEPLSREREDIELSAESQREPAVALLLHTDDRGDVEAQLQEVYSRLFTSKVRYCGYFPLLRYMKEILAHVVAQAYRGEKRRIVSLVRARLSGLARHPERAGLALKLLECLRAVGFDNPIDEVLLDNLLKGEGVAQLTTNPIVQEAFSRAKATDLEKFIYNHRDTAVWRAYKGMRKIQHRVADQDCHQAVVELLT